MSILLGLLANPTVLAVLGGIGAVVFAFLKGKSSGAAKERQKQATERQKARDVADEVDNDIGALTPEQVKERLSKWAR